MKGNWKISGIGKQLRNGAKVSFWQVFEALLKEFYKFLLNKTMHIRINIQGTGQELLLMYSSLLNVYCCSITSAWYGSVFTAVY